VEQVENVLIVVLAGKSGRLPLVRSCVQRTVDAGK